ncbi:AI-2E family transporter [Variovorax sp. J31P207]|uniref:AI-2E family transporter n=1 Tax=Variovorax sp. J31P207 TaxID=3053510 RepID=UPI0025785B30|nr:AI-2E family transporter [Variovorax sp. J31P207]MDM0068424.1 AI-2E family transporter [Variovorax sp. J31P207]
MNSPALQRGTFLFLLAVVTIAFGWILFPFFGAVMWGLALAILFTPIYRRLLKKMGGRRNLAAITTLLMAMVVVIIPLVAVSLSLVEEVSLLSQKIRSGDISFSSYFQQVVNAIPKWALSLLDRFGLGNVEGLIKQVSQAAARGSQAIATHAVAIGQNTFEFLISFGIMLYLLFFLLRDGADLSKTIRASLPLAKPHTHYLLNKFTTVIRATIKGNVAVAAAQGLIGGVTFSLMGLQGSLLWGALMAFLSLLPAVGAALIWGPVAIYFLAVGATAKALGLIFVGVFVIGLVDNILRPLLVGKDTQMPDYVVLMSTIGGIALFGINGFVIGPVIAALFMAAWDLFASSNEADDNAPPPLS